MKKAGCKGRCLEEVDSLPTKLPSYQATTSTAFDLVSQTLLSATNSSGHQAVLLFRKFLRRELSKFTLTEHGMTGTREDQQ